MPDYIHATVFTNLDPKLHNTPKHFEVKFPAMPQVGHIVEWDGRSCHICQISWVMNGMGVMQLHVEINK